MNELLSAADYDLRSGLDQRAWNRRLFPRCSIAGDLHLKTRRGSQFDDLAHRQPDERWDLELSWFADHDG